MEDSRHAGCLPSLPGAHKWDFTIESCTLFLSPIRLENLSPLFISATQATQSCEGDASKLAASFARTVSSVRRSEKTTWRLGRRRAKDWL